MANLRRQNPNQGPHQKTPSLLVVIFLLIAGVALGVIAPRRFDLSSTVLAEETVSSSLEKKRRASLAIAKKFAQFQWRATKDNVFHGEDQNGVRVDTPDRSFVSRGFSTDGVNVGLPYQWGGFSSLEEFEAGLRAGKWAGHLPRGRGAQGSSQAIGLDCSGFVSRCWELPTKQSTRSLGDLCYELESYDDLKPGDILNTFDGHVMLFEEFLDEDRTEIRVYEAVTPKVKQSVHTRKTLEASGYLPLRYRPFDPRWASVALEFENPSHEFPKDLTLESLLWEATSNPDPNPSRLDHLNTSISAPQPGDWVRYRIVSRRTNQPENEVMETFRGVTRDPASLHVRVEENRAILDTLEPHDSGETLLEAWIRRMSPKSTLSFFEVLESRVQEGTVEVNGRKKKGTRVEVRASVRMPTGRQEIALRVAVEGIWTASIPLGGFLAADVRIEVLGPASKPVDVIENSYSLRSYRTSL